jgi:hypothetical protein
MWDGLLIVAARSSAQQAVAVRHETWRYRSLGASLHAFRPGPELLTSRGGAALVGCSRFGPDFEVLQSATTAYSRGDSRHRRALAMRSANSTDGQDLAGAQLPSRL